MELQYRSQTQGVVWEEGKIHLVVVLGEGVEETWSACERDVIQHITSIFCHPQVHFH